ncbi:hypothetical protein GCM10027290_52060 [Micromonospora sonneratiae]|uniref:Uncharacterized protein n=1 Tax=Micromonospora sonneratiae TaxID=1184706 RepID=A0ABW3YBS0_9ACTN
MTWTWAIIGVAAAIGLVTGYLLWRDRSRRAASEDHAAVQQGQAAAHRHAASSAAAARPGPNHPENSHNYG